ncbi:MAG: haloacid dehalogenase-like hydrolase, partial [Eubacteriales bacterium]|nr:haloacid dehalogenase-like hydrolase [Eubacteriales bacterium]
MKRTLALILAIVMALGLCCGTAFADGPKQESAAPQESAETVAEMLTEELSNVEEGYSYADAFADPEGSGEDAADMPTDESTDPGEEEADEDVFADWNEDAPALNTLIEYVEAVTDEESPDYIPVSDRIAVFDMDGTLYGELFPTYLEYYLLAWRILKDPSYEPDAEMLEFGRMLRDHAMDKQFPDHMDLLHANHAASAYAGLTLKEFAAFVNECLIRDVDGFEGMTYATAFYQPMLEVIDYLQDNDFRVYVCSGSDRAICRALLEGMIDIPYANIIGMDVVYDATGQGDADGLDYVFKADDDVVRTDKLIIKNLKMNKVRQIVQDIGQQPVLSFGNSSGDVSMHMFTISNNAYRSAAFMLIADDETRDYGNEQKVQSLKEKWEDYGFHVISMKNDFRTIYGDEVVKTGSFRWAEEMAEDRVPVEYSPDWVAALPEAQDASQLFVAAGVGETTATVSLHEKDSSGKWRQVLTTPGYIGKNGLGKEVEGDGKTPVGTFTFNAAFGIAEDPGCAISYHQVTGDDYWSGDQRKGYHYNEMVSIKDLPDLNTADSEHLADFDPAYQYALSLSYNAEGTPGLGSAIFVHCLRPDRPFSKGCVVIPEAQMRALMQRVRPDCVVVIDSLEKLSPETWSDWGLAPTETAAADASAAPEAETAASEASVDPESEKAAAEATPTT